MSYTIRTGDALQYEIPRLIIIFLMKLSSQYFSLFYFSAFVAHDEKAPVNIEQEEIERRNLKKYKSKLKAGVQMLPDPLSQKKGKSREREGIRKWPSLYLTDISRLFQNVISSEDLIHRLECEYKEGKAYRYFTDEFVKDVYFHLISPSSPFCMIKTECTPSQRVSAKAYDLWVTIKKDTDEHPGGDTGKNL